MYLSLQNLKRREREYESEMQKFAREKILLQEKMRGLKDELHGMDIDLDLSAWVTATQDHDNETNSTSTATGTRVRAPVKMREINFN